MKISDFLARNLASSVTGDDTHFPYRTGEKLVLFFNQLGFKDVYPESVIQSRRIYTQTRIKELESDNLLKRLVDMVLDPRTFFDTSLNINEAAEYMKSYLKLEGYDLTNNDGRYRLITKETGIVEHREIEILSYDFINEQIDKCGEKIQNGDYDGAITNSRSLIESICIQIIEKINKSPYKSDGKLQSIYKDLKDVMNLNIDKSKYPDSIIEILSGLITIINGISGISNNASDRHHRIYKPQKHHAKLAVNVALSFCVFIVESYQYQGK